MRGVADPLVWERSCHVIAMLGQADEDIFQVCSWLLAVPAVLKV
jgi:hypothetical protein